MADWFTVRRITIVLLLALFAVSCSSTHTVEPASGDTEIEASTAGIAVQVQESAEEDVTRELDGGAVATGRAGTLGAALLGDEETGPAIEHLMEQLVTAAASEDSDDETLPVCLAVGFIYESRQLLRDGLFEIELAVAEDLFMFWNRLAREFNRAYNVPFEGVPVGTLRSAEQILFSRVRLGEAVNLDRDLGEDWQAKIEPMHLFARNECGAYIDLDAIEVVPATELLPTPTPDEKAEARAEACPAIQKMLESRSEFRSVIEDQPEPGSPLAGEQREAYEDFARSATTALESVMTPTFYLGAEVDTFALRGFVEVRNAEVDVRHAVFGPGQAPVVVNGYSPDRRASRLNDTVQDWIAACDLAAELGTPPAFPAALDLQRSAYDNDDEFDDFFCASMQNQFDARSVWRQLLADLDPTDQAQVREAYDAYYRFERLRDFPLGSDFTSHRNIEPADWAAYAATEAVFRMALPELPESVTYQGRRASPPPGRGITSPLSNSLATLNDARATFSATVANLCPELATTNLAPTPEEQTLLTKLSAS